MQLEEYFDFLGPDDIRLTGSRIGIESILYEHIHRAQAPEEIVRTFPTLTLEQVHATILYYLRNREMVNDYLSLALEYGREAREQQARRHNPLLRRLRHARDQKQDQKAVEVGVA